jgi:hypothetical protein
MVFPFEAEIAPGAAIGRIDDVSLERLSQQ